MLNLFCDLDGVLVDFDKGVFESTGKYPHQFKNVGFMWSSLEKDPTFWTKLNWTCDGQKLWDFIFRNSDKFNIQILTGLPEGKLKQTSDEYKRIWVKNHLGADIIVNTCIGSQKYKFCKLNDILIDDRLEYKENWEKAGGIFVHHIDTETTITELTKILSLGENYKILLEEENKHRIANPTPVFDIAKYKKHKVDIKYLGVFLTVATQKQLLKMFSLIFENTYANTYADHITLAFNPDMHNFTDFEFNKTVSFKIIGYAFDSKCQTVVVKFDDDVFNTKIHHITISTTRNTPPVYSNELIERGFKECSSDILNCTLTGKTGAMVNVRQKEESEESEDLKEDFSKISQETKDIVFQFMAREIPEEKILFPVGSLDPEQRQILHKFAENNNLISESIGDKSNRQLTLRKPRQGEEVVVRKREDKATMRLLFDKII
jgi:hypothetical protein